MSTRCQSRIVPLWQAFDAARWRLDSAFTHCSDGMEKLQSNSHERIKKRTAQSVSEINALEIKEYPDEGTYLPGGALSSGRPILGDEVAGRVLELRKSELQLCANCSRGRNGPGRLCMK